MVPINLFSEKYPATGGMSGNAIRRNLGRTQLDNLSVLIREAVQNSWDARLDPNGSITFEAHLGSLLHNQVRALQTEIFTELPEGHPLETALKNRLPMRRLILMDRGTFGLNGPVFHVPRKPGTPSNFMRFLRDIGRGGSEALSGGTYGFGKSCLFTASEVSTILVHTRYRETADGPALGERFMVASLCDPPEDESLTGRHWWGVPVEIDGGLAVAPAEGRQAARLARILGFPAFGEDETGTSIMILKPRVWENDGVSLTAEQIAETMTSWFWPRMLPISEDTDTPFILFNVWGDDGSRVDVPDPRMVTHLVPFVHAFQAWRKGRDGAGGSFHGCKLTACETLRPIARVGWVAVGALRQPAGMGWSLSGVENHPLLGIIGTAETPPQIRHVALMRSTWQVIKYQAYDRIPPDPFMGYAGVFVVDSDREGVEEAYAQSEPPSHDDWIESSLSQKAEKVVVKAHRRAIEVAIGELFEEEFSNGLEHEGAAMPLGTLSRDLGRLLAGGLHAPPTQAMERQLGGVVPKSHFSIQSAGVGRLERQGDERVFILPFQLNGVIPDGGIRLRAHASVLVDGGTREKEPPLGSDRPTVLRWEDANGVLLSCQCHCEFKPGPMTMARVVVGIPEDSRVKVLISTEPC